ncbi:hypothetical protein EV702DRAFT_1043668 [Suillus placidus]|uniref:Uncharacterized protein n=1 Tax=Suillus placidus TaxID=48579 RepID=A0A9P6ZZU5_9AGAM|nr:hypothetical protein EV702DRAFT_1043668 [Suillus placidus]
MTDSEDSDLGFYPSSDHAGVFAIRISIQYQGGQGAPDKLWAPPSLYESPTMTDSDLAAVPICAKYPSPERHQSASDSKHAPSLQIKFYEPAGPTRDQRVVRQQFIIDAPGASDIFHRYEPQRDDTVTFQQLALSDPPSPLSMLPQESEFLSPPSPPLALPQLPPTPPPPVTTVIAVSATPHACIGDQCNKCIVSGHSAARRQG